jgi:hypothetical protein
MHKVLETTFFVENLKNVKINFCSFSYSTDVELVPLDFSPAD